MCVRNYPELQNFTHWAFSTNVRKILKKTVIYFPAIGN